MLRKKKSNHKPDILVLEDPIPPITKKEGKTPRKIRLSEPDKLIQLYLNEPVKLEKNPANNPNVIY